MLVAALNEREIAELVEECDTSEAIAEIFLLVDHRLYCADDLAYCSVCELAFPDDSELDQYYGDPICWDCLADTMDEASHIASLRASYYCNLL